jgi:aspartyl-tRNA(Asn)/glutamyl-tRNA(Gln) amidotransferase subunit A
MPDPTLLDATAIAAAVKAGTLSARAVAQAHLDRIEKLNPSLNAFTDVTAARALAAADRVDARRAAGAALGPMAGVPYAVKNLFDIEGVVTRAGSKINRENAPAKSDATFVKRMDEADAVLLGGLNMGEYAYDFTGENAHDGASRNPHDLSRMSGGSSGGSGTAAASGMAPVTLGSDTNGSIRVPSSLCGLFGLKATYGRFSRAGTFPFVGSFDHVGPLARSVADLALVHDVAAGADPTDPVCSTRPVTPLLPVLEQGISGLRIARAGGYFARGGLPEAYAGADIVAEALGLGAMIDIADAGRARAAAYVITMAEGAALHLPRIRTRPQDFDPAVRDRLIAGAMVPASWVIRAQNVRRAFQRQMLKLFETVDVIVTPATPCVAPAIGQMMFTVEGQTLPVRPNLGLYTQPFSFIGLPAMSVPVKLPDEPLPIGVQIVAAPWREDHLIRLAAHLEKLGICTSSVAGA